MTWEFPPDCGSTFRFQIRSGPLFAGVGDPTLRTPIQLDPKVQACVTQQGIQLTDPDLIFAARGGAGATARDPHPIRGVLKNRPFDYALTVSGLADRVSAGVVCPSREAGRFESYLQGLLLAKSPASTERDYLLDFPGFQTAFGLPLELPTPGERGWVSCADPRAGLGTKEATLELARNINNAIESLHAACKPNVVVVCIPARWGPYRRYDAEDERIDLHDFVKAYCVRRGIATQFLEEDTLANPYQCRISWWLSLAFYVKSMRTPWVLDSLDSDTAFVGLGCSLDQRADLGQHVVLGCSHLYSAQGEGLQYRLSKIEHPILRRGNPYMSRDDARRVGDGIRELFFDSRMKLPSRVALHKRTPFIREEREGLIQGLGGIKTIDMIEINVEDSLRYVASVPAAKGRLKGDNFPVRRGVIVVLDDYEALLWNHGVVPAVNPKLKHYQGKRRIPAPLLLRRHVGKTPLDVLACEILGLSKMHWNTFEMYARFPATIHSSNEIARIGALLERFGVTSYDYRLFI